MTKAVLNPVDGSDANGVAIFGRVKNSLALQVEAKGLEPTTERQHLLHGLARAVAAADAAAGLDRRSTTTGKIAAQFEVPTEVLAYLANETFDQLVITRTSDSALKAALDKATKEERAPDYTGTEVLAAPSPARSSAPPSATKTKEAE